MANNESTPEILSEADAKRRLAIYTLIRLAGIAALLSGVLLAQDGVDVATVLLLIVGAASLFIRPKMLGRIFGRRW